LDSTDALYVVLTPRKAPEEVVIDGHEAALYVQCQWHLMTTFTTLSNTIMHKMQQLGGRMSTLGATRI